VKPSHLQAVVDCGRHTHYMEVSFAAAQLECRLFLANGLGVEYTVTDVETAATDRHVVGCHLTVTDVETAD